MRGRAGRDPRGADRRRAAAVGPLRDRHRLPGAGRRGRQGERFAKPDLARVSLRSGTEVWWRPAVAPLRPLGARRAGAVVEYRAFAGERPQIVRLGATPRRSRRFPRRPVPDAAAGRDQRRARRRRVHPGGAGRRQGPDPRRAAPGRRPALSRAPSAMWTASARAKINLHLAVHARRPDGFHALTTVFQTIDLADTLTIVEHDGPFTLRCPGSDAPEDDSNLVVRAARALADELGRPEPAGLRVTLDKQVPTQAGLGGGSADAMAALRLLCEVWRVAAGSRAAGAGRGPARLGRPVLRLGRHRARPRPRRRDRPAAAAAARWPARSSGRRSASRRRTPIAGSPNRGRRRAPAARLRPAGPAPRTGWRLPARCRNDFEPVVAARIPESRRPSPPCAPPARVWR